MQQIAVEMAELNQTGILANSILAEVITLECLSPKLVIAAALYY